MQNTNIIECPVCMEQMGPPKKIFQCSNGHAFCEQCKDNPAMTSCPICRLMFHGSNISRNILAETLAKEFTSSSSAPKSSSTSTSNEPKLAFRTPKECPICNHIFDQSFPQTNFEKHVQDHFNEKEDDSHENLVEGPRRIFYLHPPASDTSISVDMMIFKYVILI